MYYHLISLRLSNAELSASALTLLRFDIDVLRRGMESKTEEGIGLIVIDELTPSA